MIMGISRLLPLFIGCLVFCSCRDRVPNSNSSLSLDYYQSLQNPSYTINSRTIRKLVDSLMRNDSDRQAADLFMRSHYRNGGQFVWIDRYGVDHRADSLLNYLRKVDRMGFSQRAFNVNAIERDLEVLRKLELDNRHDQINQVMARLEYRLTKAYLRYASGQRFGYMNPTYVFNRLDSIETNPYDTIQRSIRYRGLFDVGMQHADHKFYGLALRQAATDSIQRFLHDIQPKNPFYYQLEQKLASGDITGVDRRRILCNMERCRWRQYDHPDKHSKKVVVNIPSYHLMCIDNGDTITMRIGCGAVQTKTPLLNSYIKWMDINPRWMIPRSILLKDIARHVGNPHYFHSRNYYVFERSTGKEIDPARLSGDMLLSGAYGVAQRGGKGNALGRIIFRFDNNFSVYLHDTSCKDVFSREDRGVSHGCVRVEKPLDFAIFLLKDKDEETIEKIKYSMNADTLSNRKLVIGSLKVEPQIPLFITYYTVYPMAGGRMECYNDVYGYDEVIFNCLRKYL